MAANFGLSLCDFECLRGRGDTEHERVAEGRGEVLGLKPYPRSATDATCQLQTFMLDF